MPLSSLTPVDRLADLRRLNWHSNSLDFLTALHHVPTGWVQLPLHFVRKPGYSFSSLMNPFHSNFFDQLFINQISEFSHYFVGEISYPYLIQDLVHEHVDIQVSEFDFCRDALRRVRFLQDQRGTVIVIIGYYKSMLERTISDVVGSAVFLNDYRSWFCEEAFITLPKTSVPKISLNIVRLFNPKLLSVSHPEICLLLFDSNLKPLSSLSQENNLFLKIPELNSEAALQSFHQSLIAQKSTSQSTFFEYFSVSSFVSSLPWNPLFYAKWTFIVVIFGLIIFLLSKLLSFFSIIGDSLSNIFSFFSSSHRRKRF